MLTQSLILTSTLALLASAVPFSGHAHQHAHNEKRQDQTFNIHVLNNCPDTKQFALYQITPSFDSVQMSTPVNIASGMAHTIPAPYTATGMRLSGMAQWGTAGQWDPQPLFEFGYSNYEGQDGTAYDLSVMEGSPPDVGIAVYPANAACPSKVCNPDDCPLDQGWTNPDQDADGSPADTVCYEGLTHFRVIYCP